MKIRIWTAVTDGGDGEYHSHQYVSEENLRSDLELDDDDMDQYGYHVDISSSIFDTTGYEIVEE